MEPQQRQRKSRALGRLIVSIVLFAIAALLVLNRQTIIDRITVWRFHPSAEVAALADRTRMSDDGKYYFYASQPELQDRDAFNHSCSTLQSEQTVVLGCYVAHRIYVFNVNDQSLDGIKEVTAAHEMLHAAYERLSQSDKAHVNAMINAAAAKVTDKNIATLIAEYEKTEPGEKLNELHSILGTQVAHLDGDLEAYYSQYFTDRSAVVGLSQKYEGIFNELKSQQEQLSNQLEALANELAADSNDYNQSIVKLNADITAFNDRAESGGFSSQAQFNAERDALVARQEQLRAANARLNAKIALYNQKREQLKAINSRAEALNRSINSNLSPVPAL